MKLIVQIPCLNEARDIAGVIQTIPRNIAGIDVVERHDGGTEQQRIYLVEVVVVAGEDLGERPPVVARGAAWKLPSHSLQRGVVAICAGAGIGEATLIERV